MRLELQPELLADAIRATSEYYHIAPVYIEKDYWISKILQQLSRSIYASHTVFKGGTSLSKGYGLINRFSEDVDVAVLTGDLNGNQIKTLISKVCKEMTKGLQEQDVPEKWHNAPISGAPLLNSFSELWNELSRLYERELNALAYGEIPASKELKSKIADLLLLLKNELS